MAPSMTSQGTPAAPANPLDALWRRMAAAVFAPATDARVSVTGDLDVTEALAYLREHRPPGVPMGLLHLVAAAVARTIAEDVPAMNTYLRRGRVRPKRSLDVLLTAKVPGANALTAIRLANAHRRAARDLAMASRAGVARLRTPEGQRSLQRSYTLARLPWTLRRPLFRAIRRLSHGFGFALPKLDLAPESFGTVVLSEVGRYRPGGPAPSVRGVSVDGPLVPAAQGTSVVWLMEPHPKPVVVDGAVTIRTIAAFSVTLDHRLVDGHHIGQFITGVARRMQEPA
ncbi:MAG: 2-oxo acid dehydrogenase subunit E2, partial [Bacteroidota bacterium]